MFIQDIILFKISGECGIVHRSIVVSLQTIQVHSDITLYEGLGIYCGSLLS